jgi:hypothetical protein
MTASRGAFVALVGITVLGTVGCEPPPDLSPIGAWLSCEECEQGERAAVAALGADAVDTLDMVLSRGPSPVQRANIASQVVQSFQLADTTAAADSALVDRFRSNFIALHQQRAAIALGDIGTPGAIAALRRARDEAASRGYRADVLRVIESVLAAGEFREFHGPVVVDTSGGGGRGGGGRGRGFGPPNTAGFGDTVLVYARQVDSMIPILNGNETLHLRGGPYPGGVFLGQEGDSLMRFLAVGEPGAYTIEIGNLGPGDAETRTAPLRITSARPQLRGPGSGRGGAGDLSFTGLPDTMFVTLGSQRADTIDHYRITGTGARVHARVESARYLETASVRWLECGGAPVSMGNVLQGFVVDQQEAGIAGAVVSIPPYGSDTTTNTGFFSLTIPASIPTGIVDVDVLATRFRPVRHRIQPGADTVRIGLVPDTLSDAAAVPRFASTVVIPQGACRLIQVGIPTGAKRRIARLIIQSP